MAYFRQPLPSSVDILFFTPFSTGIWVSILAVVASLVLSAQLFCKVHVIWGYGQYFKENIEFTILNAGESLSSKYLINELG